MLMLGVGFLGDGCWEFLGQELWKKEGEKELKYFMG